MKEFVVVFRHANQEYRPSPAEMKGRMEWLAGIAAQGKLADKGRTLLTTGSRTLRTQGRTEERAYLGLDGDFVSGFMILRCEDLDEAASLLEGNPIFSMAGSVELREAIAPGGSGT